MLEDAIATLLQVFPQANSESVNELATAGSFMSVPGRASIVTEGDASDAVYVILTGLFGAYQTTAGGHEILINRMGPGDIIGDIGFVTGDPRTATVRALRNSELLRISKSDLEAAASRCPGVLLAICAALVRRLLNSLAGPVTPYKSRTFCVIPGTNTIDVGPVIEGMADALRAFGKVTIVSVKAAAGKTSSWFSGLEQTSDFILYQADSGQTGWTRFCLRQCDCHVLLVSGGGEPTDVVAPEADGVHGCHSVPTYLVLLWQAVIVPGNVQAWLKYVTPKAHYHVRSLPDLFRATRLMAGRGTGLVFSGGGARGLAHVGVLEVLRQQNVPIDVIGGTSIGGIVAALYALEWDVAGLALSLADEFGRRRISDFAIPRSALFSERTFVRTLGRWFGDIRIEDTPIPFFCVSTNLTEGTTCIHQSGPLYTWLRATSAIPGIFPPIIEDDIVYVDGGVLDNLPTGAIRDFGVATVIAVNVSSGFRAESQADSHAQTIPDHPGTPGILELLWRAGTIGNGASANADRHHADVVLRPDIRGVTVFGWHASEKAIAAGQRVALERIDEIKAAVGLRP